MTGACEDCGAKVPDGRDGCQRLFDEVLAREFGDYRYAKLHRLMVDTYSLQHPEKYMRSGKSFVAHLTGICAAVEGGDAMAVNQAVQQWLNGPRAIQRPEEPPPGQRGDLTVVYVHGAADPEEYLRRVKEWARSSWVAWSALHQVARQWIGEATSERLKR